MTTILLIGFEPFGGAADNPSQMAVQALAADPPAGVVLRTAILPVSYAAAGPALRAALARHRPDVLLATGLAGGRAEISVERVALNLDDARIGDNDGRHRLDQPVVPGGPAAYFASVPIKAMVAAIRAAGAPAQVSHSAGTFLCNHVFYLASHLAATAAPGLRVGFLHLPWLPGQVAERPGEPSLPLASMVAGLRAAIAAATGPLAAAGRDLAVAAGDTM